MTPNHEALLRKTLETLRTENAELREWAAACDLIVLKVGELKIRWGDQRQGLKDELAYLFRRLGKTPTLKVPRWIAFAEFLENHKISIPALADMMDMDRSTINKWVRGDMKPGPASRAKLKELIGFEENL